MTEYELIQNVKNGDKKAFRVLVEQYQQKVFTTCMGFLLNKEDAEDIAQEVFVEVYRSVDKFRQESRLSTWLYRISVNKSLNHIKKDRKNRLMLSLENIFISGSEDERSRISKLETDEDNIEKRENALVLHNAIESLGTNQKIAFTLHKYDDLSYKEISEIMDLSLSSVESLIHRAKLNLHKKLIKHF
jgi:RNA polymerase sigma-70 factor, ECF subfamily